MKQIKIIIIPIILILFYNNVRAQTVKNEALKIGDKVPDITLSHILNYKTNRANLSDFRGKFIILDFWDRYCPACIQGFPKMENLQNKFDGKIQILAVTSDSLFQLQNLLAKSPIVKNTKLPLVIEDKELHELFPHKLVPFHIWIDDKGIVKAMTWAYNATAEHIDEFLNGGSPNLPIMYADVDNSYDFKSPIITEGNGRQLKNVKYYSLITDKLIGNNRSAFGSNRDSITNEIIGLVDYNNSKLALFISAFDFHILDRVKLEVHNPESYIEPRDPNEMDAWKSENSFSYELVFPGGDYEKWRKIMQVDIQNFFGIQAQIEKRFVKCIVLQRITKADKLKTKNPNEGLIVQRTSDVYVMKNAPLDAFLNDFRIKNIKSKGLQNLPLVDETNYRGNVDMEIRADFDDIPALNKELRKYGLQLIEGNRSIEMLVLRDSKQF